MKSRNTIFFAPLALIAMAATGHAAFSLIDNMEGANGWSGDGTLTADPAGSGNQVFSVANTGSTTTSHLSLGSGIASGTTGTLFFRVRAAGNTAAGTFDWVFGSTSVASPSEWSDFNGYGAMNNSASNGDAANPMAVRDGTSFDFFGPASADTWYNVWLVLNNDTEQTTMYFNTGLGTPATDPSTLSSSGAFRNTGSDPLINLFVRNNGGAGSIGYLDDVYLDTTGANLTNPIPEPSSSLLAGLLFGLGVLRRRR